MFPNIHERKRSMCTFEAKKKFALDLRLDLARDKMYASKQSTHKPKLESWASFHHQFISYKQLLAPNLYKKPPVKSKPPKPKVKTSTADEELYRIKSKLLADLTVPVEEPKIITWFPRMGRYEIQLMYVKTGKFKASKYEDPKPYDYRQFEKDIPDFVTSCDKDPSNLKFKTHHLNIHRTQPLTEDKKSYRANGKFNTFKKKEPKWDSNLYLQKEPWPVIPEPFRVITNHNHLVSH